jgi:prepilin-type N-terminal cleavage/methylation domain-containing protein
MNWRFKKTSLAFYAHKNEGFSLMEVLCALVILVLVILATFAALDYALKITVASRSRMDAFATAERMAVAALARGKAEPDPRVDFSSTVINGTFSIDGVDQSIEMEVVVYKEKLSAKFDRLMKRPVFITFLKKT